MALAPMTLQERIKKSQDLAKKSTTELAAQQGLAQAPTSAIATGALGGTPQQQAMAGTPAQKKTVLEAVAAPRAETGLELAQKTRPASAIDQVKQQKMQRFSESLGTFGDKVNELIEGATNKIISGEGQLKATLVLTPEQKTAIDTTKSKLADADKTALDAALATLSSQGRTEAEIQKAIFDLNKLLGKTTTDSLLTGTAFQGLYQTDITGQVGEQAQAGIQTGIGGQDRILTLDEITTLGTTPDELRQLLGMTADEDPMKLTIGEMQARLAQVQQTGFAETQAVQAGRASALLSDTEKEALRGTMLQLEEAGIAGAELQFQNLLDDIDAGTTVQIAGTDYTIDDILQSDVISNIADKYFADLPSDKEWRKKFLQDEPALAKWFDTNRTGLQAALAAGSGQADKLVTHNKTQDQTRNIFKDTGILESRPGLGDNYKPGTLVPIGTNLDWSAAAVGQTIADIVAKTGPQQKTAISNLSNGLAAIPENFPNKDQFINDIMAAGSDKLQLDQVNSPVIGTLIASMSEYDNFTKAGTPQDKLNMLFLDDRTIEEINKILQDDVRRSSMGLGTSSYFEYDLDKNGFLSDEEINKILSRVKPPSAQDILAGKTFAFNALDSSVPPPLEGLDQIVFNAMADGRVDAAELASLSLDQLAELFNKRGRPGEGDRGAEGAIDKGVRDAYLQGLERAVNESFTSLGLDAGGLAPDWDVKTRPDDTNRYAGMSDKDYRDFLDAQTLRKQIPLYTQSIDALRKLANETANPDLKWRLNTKADELTNARNIAQQQVTQYETSPKTKATLPEQVANTLSASFTAGGLVSAVTGLPIQATQIPAVKKGIQEAVKTASKAVTSKAKKVLTGK